MSSAPATPATRDNPRRQALDLLEIESSPDEEALRGRMMEHLASEEFALSDNTLSAIEVLLHPDDQPAPTDLDVDWFAPRLTHEEVNEFADEFFELPSEERRERWEEMKFRAQGDPVLSRWIDRLKLGLDVEVPEEDADEPATTLAIEIADLFLLPARLAAERRRAMLRKARSSPYFWLMTLQRLEQEHPAIIQLDPLLAKRLADVAPLPSSPERLPGFMSNRAGEWPKLLDFLTEKVPPGTVTLHTDGGPKRDNGVVNWLFPIFFLGALMALQLAKLGTREARYSELVSPQNIPPSLAEELQRIQSSSGTDNEADEASPDTSVEDEVKRILEKYRPEQPRLQTTEEQLRRLRLQKHLPPPEPVPPGLDP